MKKQEDLRRKEKDLWEMERKERQSFGGRGDAKREDRTVDRDRERESYRGRRDYDSRPSRRERSISRGRDRRRGRGRSNSRERRPRSNSREKSSPRARKATSKERANDRKSLRDDSRDRYERYERIDRRDDRSENWRGRNRNERESLQKRDDSLERMPRDPPKPRNISPEHLRFQRPSAGSDQIISSSEKKNSDINGAASQEINIDQ